MFNCKFCDKDGKNKNSQVNHERMCPKNPDRKPPARGMAGKSPWNKGYTKETLPQLVEQGKKISASLKKSIAEGNNFGPWNSDFWTDELRLAHSEMKKEFYKQHPEKHPNRILAGNRSKMTYLERVAFDWLTSAGIEFDHQVGIQLHDKTVYPDFKIGMMLIEIDGKYWHNPEQDLRRDCELEKIGFNVVRIKASDKIEERLKTLFIDKSV